MAQIALQPTSGLCNRWRAVLSGIGLAKTTGRRLRVWWPPGFHCKCGGGRTWDVVDNAFAFMGKADWDKCHGKHFGRGARDQLERFDPEQDIRVTANYTFGSESCGPISQWAHLMKPKAFIQKTIDNFYDERMKDRRVVSVNVRWYHCHPKSKQTKPAWFRQRMREIMSEYGADVLFLLSVDDKKMSDEFHEAFPDNVIEAPRKTYDIGTTRVAYACIVETYLMSMTSHVLGSYWSSFSRHPTILNPSIRLETHKHEPREIEGLL